MEKTMIIMTPLNENQLRRVQSAAPGWRILNGKDRSVWLGHLPEAEIVGGWNKEAATACLAGHSSLRWVHNWGAGVDSLPLEAFRSRGILVTNSSGVHPYPISETIFALMLAFTRKIQVYVRNQAERKWHHANLGQELHGRTLGILGVGAIGRETARVAKAFGMKVLGLRRSGEPMPEVDRMYDYRGLNEVLRESDYVVNILPLTPETRHWIGEEQFRAMKPSAFYVNVGRGQTTDTDALMRALTEGRIAGAGLDVFEQEPLPPEHPLWGLDNVIITPHTAGSTIHYNDRVLDIFLPNLEAYLAGKPLVSNVVDLELGY